MYSLRFPKLRLWLPTKRVGFELWWRKVIRFFYLEVTEKAILIEKIERENAISIYILVANFFTSERAFFVAKLPYAIPNSFTTAIALFLECCLAEFEISLLKS